MIYGSVCSGIEAATAAWHPLGWKPAFFSEIEAFPSAVLAHHYPHVPNFGDMTKFEEWPDATIDVLVGGTPCQSFSHAGLRKGLDDQRGNLMLVYAAIARRYRPRWLVWENVPGVLSSDEGRDFGSLLGLLSGQKIEVPKGGWQSAGIVPGIERAYGAAWRIIDAQYCRVDGFERAVPQRRRRVFVVGYLGDWRRAAAVLFERESLLGNPPPRRQAGERPAPTLSARTQGGGGLGTDFDCDGGLIANALTAHGSGVSGPDLEHARAGHLIAFGGNNQSGPIDVATACLAKGGSGHGDFESETFVAHALRAEGFDASEDGTGRGTPLVPVSFAIQAGALRENPHSGPDGVGVQEGHAYTLEARAEVQAVCHSSADSIQGVALRGREGGASAELTGDVMTALRTGGGGGDKPHVLAPAYAFSSHAGAADGDQTNRSHAKGGPVGFGVQEELSYTLRSGRTQSIAHAWRVRRLMPIECERLQGFPDGYTNVPYRGKPASDGPRYKALGNSMAVNVMRWIGSRIDIVDKMRSR
jgi:DNA (cytosine-5)-methyltransferase 1